MYFLRRYDWTLHMAALVLCAYFLARALTTYLAGVIESPTTLLSLPPTPAATQATRGKNDKDDTDASYKLIVDRNIFNSADIPVSEAVPTQGDQVPIGELGPAVKTSLSIKVESTLMIGEGTDRRSSTIVSGGKAKASQAYFIGDDESFAPNVRLTKVDKDRIEFVNGGRLEFAELEDWSAKKSVFLPPDEAHGKEAKTLSDRDKLKGADDAGASAGKIELDQKEVDDALQNLDKLQKEVNIVPNFQDGKMDGFKVVSIKPGGLVSKLGVRRGDVLKNVNGQELDIKRGMELFGSMKDSKNFSLDVVRGGKNQTLEYEIR